VNAAAAILWFALLAAMFLLFIVLPQRRRMQAFHAMQAALRVGDEVVTTSGLFGRIVALREDSLDLEIAPGTIVKLARQAVGQVLSGDGDGGGRPPA